MSVRLGTCLGLVAIVTLLILSLRDESTSQWSPITRTGKSTKAEERPSKQLPKAQPKQSPPSSLDAVANQLVPGVHNQNSHRMDFSARHITPWGFSYSPFTREFACKPTSEVARDFADIEATGARVVRLCSANCGILDAFSQYEHARQNTQAPPLNMIIDLQPAGEALGSSSHALPDEAVHKQLLELNKWNYWHRIHQIVVENQGVANEVHSTSHVVQLLAQVREFIDANVPADLSQRPLLTIAEPPGVWLSENSAKSDLIESCDSIGLVVQPFFQSHFMPSFAGNLVSQAKQLVRSHISGYSKPLVVLETGWPSAGNDDNGARASSAAQSTAIQSILKLQRTQDTQIILYSYCDETWRDPGVLGVETHFGLSRLFALSTN